MAMTLTEKRERRAARKAQAERASRVQEAVTDEHIRFNRAIARGAVVMLPTHSGTYRVERVTHDWQYFTPKANGGFGMSWAGCNDGVWADLMAQVGEPRNRLFAR